MTAAVITITQCMQIYILFESGQLTASLLHDDEMCIQVLDVWTAMFQTQT